MKMMPLAKILINTMGFNKKHIMKGTTLCIIKDNEAKFSLSNKLIVSVSKFFSGELMFQNSSRHLNISQATIHVHDERGEINLNIDNIIKEKLIKK